MAIKIFIDQAHNSQNPNAGAEALGLREQDVTYRVGEYLAEILKRDPRFDVRVSRENIDEIIGTDTVSSLELRAQKANEWPADYFISLHANYNKDPNISGTEVYVLESPSVSADFAKSVLEAISKNLEIKDNLVRVEDFYILKEAKIPAILLELAYLSNPEDSEKFKNRPYDFALAIYEGILNYLKLEK